MVPLPPPGELGRPRVVSTLSARNLEPILAVVAKLVAPFDLETMLAEVVDAAKQVLEVSRGTVSSPAR